MLHTAIFAAAVSAADASGQCTSPSYDFCCQIGTKCNCAKGADDAAQCKGSKAVPILGKITSYKYCCQFATPCDCTKPGFMAEKVSADKLSGIWEGSVPFIIDVQATFDGSAKGHLSVNVKVAKDLIDCPTEDIAEDDSQITFPSVGTVGDCLGDGVRMDNKDPTKYYLIKNSDGTLTFQSDGYPALKMKQKSVEAQDTCSLYEISSDAASCGQSDLNCAYTKYAKAAEKGLVDGTCASQGFSVETGTTTKTYPIIGDIVVTTFSKATLV